MAVKEEKLLAKEAAPTSPVQEAVSTEHLDMLLQVTDERVARIRRIITVACAITNYQDWVLQEGAPYLQATGAEKIARLFGLVIEKQVEKKIWDDDRSKYHYQVEGIVYPASNPNQFMTALGTCSSDDKFFGRKDGRVLPLDDVPEMNILKKAYNNFTQNAIKRFLGIRNLTIEQLKAAGIDVSKIKGITYAKGGKGGTSHAKTNNPGRQSAWNKIVEFSGGDEAAAQKWLKDATTYDYEGQTVTGKTDITAVTEKSFGYLSKKIDAQAKKFLDARAAANKGGNPPASGPGSTPTGTKGKDEYIPF